MVLATKCSLSVSNTFITASIITGVDAEAILMTPRIVLQPSDTDLPFTFRRRQFPIRPGFAMSINKAQGQSLSRCGIYLPALVFTHGQLYVGLSRVGDPLALKVFAEQQEFTTSRRQQRGQQSMLIRNVVYAEII